MKRKYILLLFVIFTVLSCSKDNKDKTFAKADLIGKWEQVTPIPVDPDGGCPTYVVYLQFTEKTMSHIVVCGSHVSPVTVPYEFDGKTVTASGETITIVDLSADQLTINYYPSEGSTGMRYEYHRAAK